MEMIKHILAVPVWQTTTLTFKMMIIKTRKWQGENRNNISM